MSVRSFKHARRVMSELNGERQRGEITTHVWHRDVKWLREQVGRLWDEKTYAEFLEGFDRELSRIEKDGMHHSVHYRRAIKEWSREKEKEKKRREKEAEKRREVRAKREEEKEIVFQALIDQAQIEPVTIDDVPIHSCVSPEVHLSAEQIAGLPWHDPWFDDPIEEEDDDY